jgi:hypothetical protein
MNRLLRLGRGLASTLILIGCAGATACAALHVPAQYPTLQAAVDASGPGDTVLVAPGTYTGPGNRAIDFGGKDVALIGEGGPDVTIVDCQQANRGIYFHSGETEAAVVAGLTIKNGYRPREAGGGAICCEGASPTLTDLVLQGNSASSGGALACVAASSPHVSSCVMSGNSAHYRHGGAVMIQSSTPVIHDCAISGNTAACRGGALWIEGSTGPELRDVVMTGNRASLAGQYGGGAVCAEGSSALFIRCEFNDNRSHHGGGVCVQECGGVIFSGCIFTGNHAPSVYGGGGAWVRQGGDVTFDGCLFTGNDAYYGAGLLCRYADGVLLSSCVFSANSVSQDGGAVSSWGSDLQMTACTIFANSAAHAAGGMDCWEGSRPTITRCLIAFSTHGEAVDCDNSAGVCEPVLDCCDLYGNGGGDWTGYVAGQYGVRGNFSEDPLFCDPESTDLLLCANSSCLPGNHPQGDECGIVGAAGAGCDPCHPVLVQSASWGRIKALYQ